MEANKYIKNKIDELVLRCKFSRFGCQFASKVCDIEKHQETCTQRKDHENDDFTATEAKDLFKNTFKQCPISQIDCNLGCKEQFKHLEVFFFLLIKIF